MIFEWITMSSFFAADGILIVLIFHGECRYFTFLYFCFWSRSHQQQVLVLILLSQHNCKDQLFLCVFLNETLCLVFNPTAQVSLGVALQISSVFQKAPTPLLVECFSADSILYCVMTDSVAGSFHTCQYCHD
jgi:hypothetical protein